MKFLVDESTGVKVSYFLKDLGNDSLSVSEFKVGASDKEILDKANRENRIIITNDKDFGELVFNQGLNSSGIILLRLKDESAENKIKILEIMVRKHFEKIADNFLTVTDKSIRIRKIK